MRETLPEFKLALLRSAPFLVSAWIAAMVFGALVTAASLSMSDGLLMSSFVYSGAAQFVGLGLIQNNTGVVVIILTTILLSLRFLLYSVALIDQVKDLPFMARVILGFTMIDQVFLLARARYKEDGEPKNKHFYFAYCAAIFYVNWILGTWMGIIVGDKFANLAKDYGMDFIAYATFAAMLGPYLKSAGNIAVALMALLVYLVTSDLPYSMGIIFSVIIAIAIYTLFSYKGGVIDGTDVK